jgi:hypothetical protein
MISGIQEVSTAKSHVKKSQDNITGYNQGAEEHNTATGAWHVTKSQDNHTEQKHVTKPQDNITGARHGVKTREKITGHNHVEKSHDNTTSHMIQEHDTSTGIYHGDTPQEYVTETTTKIILGQKPETRSKRIELNVTPTTFEKLKSAADSTGISVNEAINQILNGYLKIS